MKLFENPKDVPDALIVVTQNYLLRCVAYSDLLEEESEETHEQMTEEFLSFAFEFVDTYRGLQYLKNLQPEEVEVDMGGSEYIESVIQKKKVNNETSNTTR